MAAIGRPLTGPVEQMQVWDLSCVLRAPTAAGHVWFKATAASPLFVNEGLVMGALAGLFADRVPAPLAVDPERGWMVLDDLGQEVGWEAPLEVVEEVVRAFARMQVEATGQVDRLLAAGCHDRRLDRLAAQARAWLPAIEATGELAGIDDATWLSPGRAAAVRAALPRGAGLLRRAGRPRRPALDRPRRPAPGQRGQGPGRLPVLRLDRRLRRPPVPRPG